MVQTMNATTARSNTGFLFVMLTGIVCAFSLMMWNTGTKATPVIGNITHAELNHPEAVQIRQCLKSSKLEIKFATKDRQKWFLPCQLPNGKWGMVILDKIGEEITAFVKGDGSYTAFLLYMVRQGATKTNEVLPWLQK